jgi:broad specificity phosphatase PhoE
MHEPAAAAKKTAEIIAGQIGVSDVIVEEDLTERDFGELSGHPPRHGTIFQNFGAVKGMEPLDCVSKRLMKVLDSYRKKTGLHHVLVVSHGAAINALLSSLSRGEIETGKTVLNKHLRQQADSVPRKRSQSTITT